MVAAAVAAALDAVRPVSAPASGPSLQADTDSVSQDFSASALPSLAL
jgi:hypothetical protein